MKIFAIIGAVLVAMCISCSDDDKQLPEIKPEKTGSIVIGANEYKWVRYNGLDWMTTNYKEGTPYYELTYIDSYGDEADLIDCDNNQAIADWDDYGNLYTYEEAKENAPEGWRLPTDEDWKKLEQAMGMSVETADAMGLRGTMEGNLLQQDIKGTGMHLRLGGYVLVYGRPARLRHRHLREYGYFWTATVAEVSEDKMISPAIYFRKVSTVSSQIERNATKAYDTNYEGNFPKYMSVRYVRDAVDD